MGVNASNFCTCAENQKATEHTIMESINKRQMAGGHKKMQEDNNSEGMKNSKGQRQSMSDIETGDALFESLKMDMNSLTVKMSDDLVYNGQMLSGRRHGKGVIKNASGLTIYDGYFKDDLYEGEGTLMYDNGFVYNGQFERGKRTNKGFLFSSDEKYKYEGQWANDVKSGNGTESYPDGSYYTGEFSLNKKNGRGVYYMNDGSIYEGEFLDDKIHGSGKFTWVDNKVYEGQWKNNCIDGFGVFIRNDKIYIGHFRDDKKNGSGLYLLKNGNILVGNFVEGEIEGLSLIFPLKGTKQMCFMSQSKPKILISDENEKNNIRLSMEYKQLMDFYEKNQNTIRSFYSE